MRPAGILEGLGSYLILRNNTNQDHSMTPSRSPFALPLPPQKPLLADWEGGQLSAEGGLLLLALSDQQLGLTERLAGKIVDPRNPARISHPMQRLLQQRIRQIAQGYSDCNNVQTLRHDPLLKSAVGVDGGAGVAAEAYHPRMRRSLPAVEAKYPQMEGRKTVFLKGASGDLVEVELIEDMALSDIRRADLAWRSHLRSWRIRASWDREFANALPEHIEWSWRRKAARFLTDPAYRFIGIRYEGAVQAIMLVKLDGAQVRHPAEAGQSLAYVEYLSVAPWNLSLPGHSPRYRGGGSALLLAAMSESRRAGHKGRVGLHSLTQAEDFYRALGFTDLGLDPDYQDLRYFELTEERAKAIEQRGGF